MADIFDAYPMSAAWDEMFARPGVPRPPYESVFATIQPLAASDLRFRAEVRNRRLLQQAQQIERLSNGRMSAKINGRDVTPTLVNGSFRLG